MGGSQEEINSAPMMTGGKDAISACGRRTPYVDPAFFLSWFLLNQGKRVGERRRARKKRTGRGMRDERRRKKSKAKRASTSGKWWYKMRTLVNIDGR